MSRMNVGTPKFYVDWMQYARAIGIGHNISDAPFGLNPSKQYSWDTDTQNKVWKYFGFSSNYNINQYSGPKLDYIAVLGHNFADVSTVGEVADTSFDMRMDSYTSSGSDGGIVTDQYVSPADDYNIVNSDERFHGFRPQFSGFSIAKCNTPSTPWNPDRITFRLWADQANTPIKVCALSAGSAYSMPHSPDLNVKMSIDMDGIKSIQTKGGSTISNASYISAPKWGSLPAWGLTNQSDSPYWGEGGMARPRPGRRSWQLSFSFLSDSDLFPLIAANNSLEHSDADITDGLNDTFFRPESEGQNNFFSQVWMKTLGSHLPFIFQPDKDNNNPDQFAICRFDMNSFQINQTAPNLYSVNLKIRECW